MKRPTKDTDPHQWGKSVSPVREVVAVAFCGLLFLWQAAQHWSFLIDDAFISLRYALNVAYWGEWSFNRGERPVEGFTNFLWVVMQAVVLWLKLDALYMTKVVGLVLSLGSIGLLVVLSRRLAPGAGMVRYLPALLLALSAPAGLWALAGLETMGQVFLLLLFVERLTALERGATAIPWLGLVGAAALMVRLDSAVWLLGAGCYALLLLSWPRLKLVLLYNIGTGFLLLVVWLFWKYSTFGTIIPQTFAAKQSLIDNVGRGRAIQYIYTFFFSQSGTLLGLGWMNLWLVGLVGFLPIFGRMVRQRSLYVTLSALRRILLLLVPVCLGILYCFYVNGDWMPGFRFLLPTFVFTTLLIPVGVQSLVGFPKRSLLTGFVFAMSCLYAAEQLRLQTVYVFGTGQVTRVQRPMRTLWPLEAVRAYQEPFIGALDAISGELLLRTNDRDTVMMSDIGQPMWYAIHARVRDIDGLVSPGFVLTSPDPETRMLQMQALAERIMRTNAPRWLLVFRVGGHPDEDSPGAYFYPAINAFMMEHPDQEFYERVWQGSKSGGTWNILYRRRGTEDFSDAAARLERIEDVILRSPRMLHPRWLLVRELYRTEGEERSVALADFLSMLERSSEVTLPTVAADQLNEMGYYSEALAVLDASLRRNPKDGFLHWKKIRMVGTEDEAAVEAVIREALPYDDPTTLLFYGLLLELLEYNDRTQDVLALATEMVQINPTDQRAWQAAGSAIHRLIENGEGASILSAIERLRRIYRESFGQESEALARYAEQAQEKSDE